MKDSFKIMFLKIKHDSSTGKLLFIKVCVYNQEVCHHKSGVYELLLQKNK